MITKMIDSYGDAVLKFGPFSEDFPYAFLSVYLTVWEDQSDLRNYFEIEFYVYVNAESDFDDYLDELYEMEEDELDYDEYFEDDEDHSKEDFYDDDDYDEFYDEFDFDNEDKDF